MVYSSYKKQRILCLYFGGYKPPTIAKFLREEGMQASRRGVDKFIQRYRQTGTIARKPGSGRPSKITSEIKAIVDEQMRTDDETTAVQLHALLKSKGYDISLRTILRCRTSLGWTFRGSAYCQLMRDVNKQKRLEWARTYQSEAENGFNNVIWSDECTVQLETHRRFCCRKQGERPKNKPRAKHPTKVNVWAGISVQGRTGICIFDGIMDRWLYTDILEHTLLPFVRDVYGTNHRFMQDNDPKHTSNHGKEFMESNTIYWWKTPAESPDLNPIENLWHELKEYIRREVKPRSKTELVEGILQFWETVDRAKCIKYIRHLRKVIPRVIELEGNATGY